MNNNVPDLAVDLFLVGLDSPNHSAESRRAWIKLFLRDFMTQARMPEVHVNYLRAMFGFEQAEEDKSLSAAWDAVDAALKEHPKWKYRGFSVGADGPGYVASVGQGCDDDYPPLSAWSVDDVELVGEAEADIPSSPAKALFRLERAIRNSTALAS